MNKSKVAVIKCESYDENKVYDAIEDGIRLLGGIGQFASKGERLILKPNVLAGDDPDKCISTHPSVFKAVSRHFLEVTQNVCYGDSPGTGHIERELKQALLFQAAEELAILLADFEKGREVSFKDSPFTKKFVIANGVLKADGVISLSKFKTHQLTRMTGAVKNQYGCIPGSIKKGIHMEMPDSFDFSKMLVALNLLLRPRLYIMDGIRAMEGNGPGSGKPFSMNVLLFSTDPVALDSVMCRLVELNPKFVPTMQPGREWGLGTYREDEIELAGDSLKLLVNGDFKVGRGPFKNILPGGIISLVNSYIGRRPVISRERCVQCGLCVEACPVTPKKALNWRNGRKKIPPSYTYRRCIRCFCCQELCPEGAVSVKPGFFDRD
ncbi:MAG: DUF362 domain-containing protein [Spirochaetota bacterium]